MCWVAGAAKMSSSRIIKPGERDAQISGFSFQALQRGVAAALPATPAGKEAGFVRFDLFDTSELGNSAALSGNAPLDVPSQAPSVPGAFVSDADLQRYQEESYQRGLQDGKNLAERGLLNVFKGLRTAAEVIQSLREKVLRDSEDDLLALSLAVARKVIAREVVQDRDTVLRLIRSALQALNEQDALVIRIHPDDHALLMTSQNSALKNELAAVKFTLKPDPTIEIGSCQIEAERGTVDTGFEVQLEEVYRHLLEERTKGIATADTMEKP